MVESSNTVEDLDRDLSEEETEIMDEITEAVEEITGGALNYE